MRIKKLISVLLIFVLMTEIILGASSAYGMDMPLNEKVTKEIDTVSQEDAVSELSRKINEYISDESSMLQSGDTSMDLLENKVEDNDLKEDIYIPVQNYENMSVSSLLNLNAPSQNNSDTHEEENNVGTQSKFTLSGYIMPDLMRTKNIPTLSEASAYWYVEKQASTSIIKAGEVEIKKYFGIDPNAPGENMVDLLKVDNGGKLVPIEVKNQKTIALVGEGNSAANKFSNISKKTNMNEITHFEIICNETSKLPPNFMSDSTGKIYELVSGSNPPEWIEWKFGNKNVYIRKADLGDISQ